MAIYKDLRYRVGTTIGTAATGASQVLLKKVTATSGDSNITFDSYDITSSGSYEKVKYKDCKEGIYRCFD